MAAGSLQSRNRGTSIPTCTRATSRDTYTPGNSPIRRIVILLLFPLFIFGCMLACYCPLNIFPLNVLNQALALSVLALRIL